MDELYPLAGAVVALAAQKGLTLATAESLTAGLIAATIADVPGASKVLRGGVASYMTDVKRRVLGVNIAEDQVVSADCAMQMAEGARGLLAADIAVSATGVAGPDDTPDGRAGTVWIGCADEGSVTARNYHFTGNRQAVRRETVRQALTILLDFMKGGH